MWDSENPKPDKLEEAGINRQRGQKWYLDLLTNIRQLNLNFAPSTINTMANQGPQDLTPALNINLLLLSVSASPHLLRAAQDLVHRVSKRVRNTAMLRAKALHSLKPKSNNQVRITLHVLVLLPQSMTFSVEAAAYLDQLRTIPEISLRIHPIVTLHQSAYGQTLFRALHTGQLGEIAHTLSQAAVVFPLESSDQPVGMLGLVEAFLDVMAQLLCSHLALSNATRFKFQSMLGRPTVYIYLSPSPTDRNEDQLVDQAILIARHSARQLNENASTYLGALGGEEKRQDVNSTKIKPATLSARPRTANVASTSTPSCEPTARAPSPQLLRTAPGSSSIFLVARLDCGIDIRVASACPHTPVGLENTLAHDRLQANELSRLDPIQHKPRPSPHRPHTATEVDGIPTNTPALRVAFSKPGRAGLPPKSSLRSSNIAPPRCSVPILAQAPEKAFQMLGLNAAPRPPHYLKTANQRFDEAQRQASERQSERLSRVNKSTERARFLGITTKAEANFAPLVKPPVSAPVQCPRSARLQFLLPPSPPTQVISSPERSPLLGVATLAKFPLPPRPARSCERPRTAPNAEHPMSEREFWRKDSKLVNSLTESDGERLESQLELAGRAFRGDRTPRRPRTAPSRKAQSHSRPGMMKKIESSLDGQVMETIEVELEKTGSKSKPVGNLKGILLDQGRRVDLKITFDRQLEATYASQRRTTQNRPGHEPFTSETRPEERQRKSSGRTPRASRFNSIRSNPTSDVGSVYSTQISSAQSEKDDDDPTLVKIAGLLQDRRRRADTCSVVV
ncbi:hypothetical protein CROQUDRAFT_721676 [Cronartium quercuum f. sp. fusiforme G11]|uniref:Uncharacterized protein n=1 Tax=Cronartium quercuum f. sp. fusiforme G11 TaxID=708437 RepID=A0A9P6TE99_9BASI|nr:hypothetical protein CROQUDRAFT_721676 [Cronartium quercuum f. sp. fusiforme G11]